MSARPHTRDHEIIAKHSNIHSALYTSRFRPTNLDGLYAGHSAFLVGCGPSLKSVDTTKLQVPGVLIAAMNNAPKTIRPHLWIGLDSPCQFLRSIWLDPTILKFTPAVNADRKVFDSDAWKLMATTIEKCPGVFFFMRNNIFKAADFLVEDSFCWGGTPEGGFPGRSVLLPALKLLYILGIKTVYLLGTDFKMSPGRPYHFAQTRDQHTADRNNQMYTLVNTRLTALRPYFDKVGFTVYNCTEGSSLTAFPRMSYDEAVAQALQEWGNIDIDHERSEGLYDQRKPH